MLQRYLIVWLSLLSLIAFAWPDWVSEEYDPFAATKAATIDYLFPLTMFAIGCLLTRKEIDQVRQRWPTVFAGTAVQFISMPILAYFSAKLFGLQDDLLLGVIMVGCVPGAMASNVLTLSARGNVSYSVSLTTLATMLSPIFVPLVLFLILKQSDVDALAIAEQAFFILLIQVVGPVLSGFFLARAWSQLERFMRRWGPIIANLTILWIIAVVVNSNHENLKKLVDPISVGAILVIALLIINLSGFLAGWCSGRVLRLPDGMRRALTLEIGMQNAGLGVILAGKLFADRDMVQLAPALYTFGCMLTGTILAQMWARYSPDEARDVVPNKNGDVLPKQMRI